MIARIQEHLRFIYGDERAAQVLPGIEALLARYAGRIPVRPSGWSQRDALLITYADSIVNDGPPLGVLGDFLRANVGDRVSFVHLLPFYPSTSDDGFSVADFRAVREDLGTWADVARLAEDYRLVFDGVINHVSAASAYVKGFCDGNPAYADFLIALDPATDTSAVLRTRNLPLLHDYPTRAGVQWLWTTFSRDQLDLNYRNPRVLLEILDVLLLYAQHGATMIRLDAIPYLWKKLGTSCAHLPETHALIKLIRDVFDIAAPHVLLLTETNVPHRENVAYFGERGDEAQVIYNFTLAPLILWSLFKGNAAVLTEWARGLEFIGRRATYLNITATHDGIGVRPTEGILLPAARLELIELARARGGDVTGKRNADGSIAPYELNLNYFDAINHPRAGDSLDTQVNRFMVSQAIPLALMEIPGIYIHSLLGSRNDHEGVRRTGRARSINRAQLQAATVAAELAQPDSLRARVFGAYRRLLRLRSAQSAFHPDARQEILDLGPSVFAVRRHNHETNQTLTAVHNVTDTGLRLAIGEPTHDLLTSEHFADGSVTMTPYQVRWLVGAT